jgi:hypothetical protein
VIPEGQKLNSWKGFSMELNLLLKPPPQNHTVSAHKLNGHRGGERMARKGMVEAGGSKSYKDVVMDRKHAREE